MKKEVTNNDLATQVAVIANDISYVKQEVRDIKSMLQLDYVTKAEFEPVRKVVYGLVSTILVAVVIALIALVIRK